MADQDARRNMGTLVWTGGGNTRKCPKCQMDCPEEGKWCMECGANMEPSAPSTTTAPSDAQAQPSPHTDPSAATPPAARAPAPTTPTIPAAALDELPPAPRSPFRLEIPEWVKALPGLLWARLTSLWVGSPKPTEPSLARKMAEKMKQERAPTFYTPGGVVEKVKADPQGYARELALAALALLILAAFYVVISLT